MGVDMILSLIILLIFIFLTLKKPIYGLTFLIVTLSISMSLLFGIDTNFIVKVLLFMSSIICAYKYGLKKNYLKIFAIAICLFVLSQIFALYTSEYSFFDALQSMMSIMIGLILRSISFKNDDRMLLLKIISALPYLSIILGLYGFRSLIFSGRYGAGTTSTNLSFLCAVSVVASLTLYNELNKNKYIIISFGSFAICFLTLTRGGMLFCTLVLLPFIINTVKRIKTNQAFILGISFITILFIIINNWNSLILRMYTSTGALNTSGRIEAWSYIVGLNTRIWVGEGIGKLFTLTLAGRYIDHFNAAHNEFIRFYYESGVIGVGLLFIIFRYIFKEFINSNNFSRTQNIMILVAFGLYSFVDNTISNYVFFVPFMLYMNAACLNESSRRVRLVWKKKQFQNIK